MARQGSLSTSRLLLRPLVGSDAPDVQRLAGDRAVAATTLNIPHPYEDGMAEEWIESQTREFEKQTVVTFGVVHRESGALVGACGLILNLEHSHAEMGYWIGKPHWGQGYATEAAQALLEYGWELGLHRVTARCFRGNPASGRVLQKIGMEYEGRLRDHAKKWGRFVDLEIYGILEPCKSEA